MRAEVYNSQGKTREAVISYRKALRRENAEFRLWTSVLAIESAYKEYTALYEDAQEAITYFPTLPFVYFAAAEGALHLNKLDEAKEFLNQGELYIIDDEMQIARYAMRYGEIEFAKVNVKKGSEQFEKALKIDSESILIKSAYALALAKAESELSKAEKLILSFLKDDQTHTAFYTALATVYIKQKEFNKAIELLKQAVRNVEYKAEMFDLLGDVFIMNGDSKNALEAWSMAKEKESRNTVLDKKINETKYYAPRYY